MLWPLLSLNVERKILTKVRDFVAVFWGTESHSCLGWKGPHDDLAQPPLLKQAQLEYAELEGTRQDH